MQAMIQALPQHNVAVYDVTQGKINSTDVNFNPSLPLPGRGNLFHLGAIYGMNVRLQADDGLATSQNVQVYTTPLLFHHHDLQQKRLNITTILHLNKKRLANPLWQLSF